MFLLLLVVTIVNFKGNSGKVRCLIWCPTSYRNVAITN